MTLQAVIVNYFSARLLTDCVQSIIDARVEKVLIVNNSPAESKLLQALEKRYSQVSILESGSNLGFGAAVNRGVATLNLADDDQIWLVNPDVMVTDPDAVTKLVRGIGQGYGIVSPTILTGPVGAETIWFGGGSFDSSRGITTHWQDGRPADQRVRSDAPLEVTFVTGAAPVIQYSAWKLLGGFDGSLFLYWEDADLCLRAATHGIKMAVVPEAVVWHQVGATSAHEGKSATYYYYMSRNRILVAGRRLGLRRLFTGAGAMWTLRFTVQALRQRNGWNKLSAVFRGTRAGLRLIRQEAQG